MFHFLLLIFVAAAFGMPGLLGFMIGEYEADHHHHDDCNW